MNSIDKSFVILTPVGGKNLRINKRDSSVATLPQNDIGNYTVVLVKHGGACLTKMTGNSVFLSGKFLM